MKKLVLFACIFVLLIGATGAVSADKPVEDSFTIHGVTDPYSISSGTLPNGRTWFHLMSEGNVEGYFAGTFTFEEWGEVDMNTGMGKNNGIITIFTDGNDPVRVQFEGKTDSVNVWGKWKTKDSDVKAHGDYTGDAGFVFSVTFDGKMKD